MRDRARPKFRLRLWLRPRLLLRLYPLFRASSTVRVLRPGPRFPGQSHQFHIAAELPEDLAASAAGRCQRIGIGHNGHAPELACAFGDRLEDSHALGAEGQAVSGVLDVAAGVDAPRE